MPTKSQALFLPQYAGVIATGARRNWAHSAITLRSTWSEMEIRKSPREHKRTFIHGGIWRNLLPEKHSVSKKNKGKYVSLAPDINPLEVIDQNQELPIIEWERPNRRRRITGYAAAKDRTKKCHRQDTDNGQVKKKQFNYVCEFLRSLWANFMILYCVLVFSGRVKSASLTVWAELIVGRYRVLNQQERGDVTRVEN